MLAVVFPLATVAQIDDTRNEEVQNERTERDELQRDKVINAISGRIEVADTVSGRFQQKKYIDVLPQPLHSHGTFTYSSKQGLVWTTLEPIASELVFNEQGIRQDMEGKTLWQMDADQPAVLTITRVMSSVLALDWDALREYFVVSGEITDAKWQLHLVPRDPVLLDLVSELTVSGNRQLQHMTLHEANGDRTEISFTIADTSSE